MDCRDFSITGESFALYECSNCHHRFTVPPPDEKALPRYYQAEHYISHSDTSKGLISKLYKLARRFTLAAKRRLMQQWAGTQPGRLLDVGSGTGAFLHYMRKAGWQAEGLEPDATARHKAQELYGLHTQPTEQLFSLPAPSFQVITLWHVLEHVSDLPAYMTRFGELLLPGGLLVLAVPNYTSADAAHYGAHWAAYDVPRHLHHFCPQSMERLAGRYGFHIEASRPMWLDAFYIALLSEQYLHGRNRFLAAGWQGLKSVISAMGDARRASSVIYILRKSATK